MQEDKRTINQYLKTKKYQLTKRLTLNQKDDLNLKEKRTYPIQFKTEHNQSGKASIIIDNNGKIQVVNLKIVEKYSKRVLKPKTYNELLIENTKYKRKIKEVQKMLRDTLKNK